MNARRWVYSSLLPREEGEGTTLQKNCLLPLLNSTIFGDKSNYLCTLCKRDFVLKFRFTV
jgi:hypothetical protein